MITRKHTYAHTQNPKPIISYENRWGSNCNDKTNYIMQKRPTIKKRIKYLKRDN